MAKYIDSDVLLSEKHGCNRKDCSNCDFFTDGDSWCQGKLFAVDVLNAPAADVVERKNGKWEDRGHNNIYQCSVCGGLWMGIGGYRFCPNCGAQMIGGDDDV